MKNDILNEYKAITEDLLNTVNSFTNDNINTVPFKDSWTAAQVADHILKSEANMPQLLAGPSIEANRDPEEKKQTLASVFLDYTSKMKSPDFIIPTNNPLEKATVLNNIKTKSEEIIAAINNNDMAQIRTAFEIPGMGPFTGAEFMWFIIFHTQRHTHQLKNILSKI